jgi:hypothetical protein
MQLTGDPSNKKLIETIFDGDQQRLRQTLDAMPEWAHAATEHPDAFWEQQQVEIRKRIAAVPEHSSTRIATAWAGAFAVILLAIFFLNFGPPAQPSGTQIDPDQELLVAVEQTVQSGLPQALEPAALLADEISRSSSQPIPTSHRVYKENPHENQ